MQHSPQRTQGPQLYRLTLPGFGPKYCHRRICLEDQYRPFMAMLLSMVTRIGALI
jgi:hypothetical protein